MATTWNADEALYRLSLHNLGATAPVSHEEEKQLLEIMFDGRAAAHHLQTDSRLSDPQRKLLQARIKAGNEARNRLIETNGRLIIAIATHFTNRGLTLAELAQEGVLGLIRALEKFDPDQGVRLNTYAAYWIRQNISRALATQGRTIRLPCHKVDLLSKVKRAKAQLTQSLGRPPEIHEIASHTGNTPEEIRELLQASQDTLSLDAPLGENNNDSIADGVENTLEPAVETHLEATLLKNEINNLLLELDPRAGRVVELRFGLRDGNPQSLGAIARRFGLTGERIRQIEKEALDKLKQPEMANRLIDYFQSPA